ncbi:MAG TPA: non-canonical purine NTP pyrophosphatase [Gemmatimonadales bacterium]|nr:non-canonical purine NTP pyrophosphatase [Gemmatimonadales bacterium]
MKLLVATRSVGKQREVRRLLAPLDLEPTFPDDLGIPIDPAEDALELGETYAENARAKAEYFARRTFLPTVADDSGLEVIALGGAPGVRSKRWALDALGAASLHGSALDDANNAALLARLAGAPPSRRLARYRCVLAYLPAPTAPAELFEGACAGTLLEEPRGSRGFGYDPLFFSADLGKTFGEAEDAEKDAVSHRGRAWRALAARLR